MSCMFNSHSAALSEADMDGMASDATYNTRAVMVQFQALIWGKFLDARAGGRVHQKKKLRYISCWNVLTIHPTNS